MSHINNSNNVAGSLTGDLGAQPTAAGTRDSHGVHHSGAGMTAHQPQDGTSATRDAQSFGSAGIPPTTGSGIAPPHGHNHGHGGLLSGLETAGGAMGASSAAQTHHTGAVGQPHAGAGALGAGGAGLASSHGTHAESHGLTGSHGTGAIRSGAGSHVESGLGSGTGIGGASALSSTGSSGLAPPLDNTYGTSGKLIDPSHTTGTSSHSHGGVASALSSHGDHSSHSHSHGDHSSHTHGSATHGAAVPAVAGSALAADHSSHSHARAHDSHPVVGASGVQAPSGGFGDGHGKQSIGGPVHPEAAVGATGAHDGRLGDEHHIGHGQTTGTHKPTIGDKISGAKDKLVGSITKNEEKKAIGDAKTRGENLPGVAAGVAGAGEIMTGRSGSSGAY